MRLSFFSILMISIIFCSSWAGAVPVRGSNPKAERFVEKFTAEMIKVVIDKQKSFSQRSDVLRKILLKNIDKHKIVIFMLGRYARKIDRKKFPQYVALIEDYAMRVFISRMLYARGAEEAKMRVVGSQKKGGLGREVIVFSKLEVPTLKQPIQIRWWLVKNKNNNTFKLFNLGVEGFWLAQEQRSQFVNFIQKNGGEPKILLPYLRRKIMQAKEDNKIRDVNSLRRKRAQ